MNVLARKTVLANLTISCWEARRFDKSVTTDILTQNKAQSDTGLFTKRLLQKKALADINKVVNDARTYHALRTQPWLDNGVRMLPTSLYLEYGRQMGEHRNAFNDAVNKFAKAYPQFIEDAKADLGNLFHEDDYPAPGGIKTRFRFDVAILPCPDSNDFRVEGIDAEDMEEIRKDVERRMQEQLKAAVAHAAERIVTTVGHMAERLKAYKPANPKTKSKAEGKFHDSLIEHVKELVEILPAFNLDDDPKFAAIIKRITEGLSVHTAADLRSDDNLRKRVAKDAAAILKDVKEFLA